MARFRWPPDGLTESDALTRRALLGMGLAALASGAAPVTGAPEPGSGPLTKAIPSTGERLPAIGLGTDAFYRAEQAAIRAEIERMVQLGGTVIDTSSDYGDSEALIGEAVAASNLRSRLFLATKLTASGGMFGWASGVRPVSSARCSGCAPIGWTCFRSTTSTASMH